MPLVNGYEAAKTIRHNAETSVKNIAFSSLTIDKKNSGYDLFNAYLKKPLVPKEFLKTITGLISVPATSKK